MVTIFKEGCCVERRLRVTMHVHKKKRSSDMDAEGARLYTYADLWDQVPIVEKSSENSLRSLRSLVSI